MTQSLRRIRGAVLSGLAWCVVWAPIGVLVGLCVDPDGSMDEMWVAIGGYPGLLCGAVFSAVVGIAERRRRLRELSFIRAGVWGAVSGLLVGLLPFAVGTSSSELPPWLLGVVVSGAVILLSTASAVGSALVARLVPSR